MEMESKKEIIIEVEIDMETVETKMEILMET